MKYNRVICTAVLFLLLGTTLPAFAQKGDEEKGGGQKAQPAQHAAQPQHAQPAKAQPQRAQQASRPAQPQRAQRAPAPARRPAPAVASNRGGNYGRISNANYTSHFGQRHSFSMGRPQMVGGYNRFQYGGYSFGFNAGWPVGWNYGDPCYVVFLNGGYYLYDVRHPGLQLTLNIF